MKNKIFNNIYQIIALILFVIGLTISYILAEIDDAPGLIIVGFIMFAFLSLVLYGIGNILSVQKKNQEILLTIFNKFKNKNK